MKKLLALITGLLLAFTVTACGNSDDGYYDDTLTPAAYGANGQCYYLSSPAEVAALQAAGLCPSTWIPAPMPAYWHQMYWHYYSSPIYINRYVPVSQRTIVIKQEKTYGTKYSSQIKTQSAKAQLKSPTGKISTGYGGGSRKSSISGGGGNRNGGTSSCCKSSRSTSSGSRSYGGGSRSFSSGRR